MTSATKNSKGFNEKFRIGPVPFIITKDNAQEFVDDLFSNFLSACQGQTVTVAWSIIEALGRSLQRLPKSARDRLTIRLPGNRPIPKNKGADHIDLDSRKPIRVGALQPLPERPTKSENPIDLSCMDKVKIAVEELSPATPRQVSDKSGVEISVTQKCLRILKNRGVLTSEDVESYSKGESRILYRTTTKTEKQNVSAANDAPTVPAQSRDRKRKILPPCETSLREWENSDARPTSNLAEEPGRDSRKEIEPLPMWNGLSCIQRVQGMPREGICNNNERATRNVPT